MREALYSHSNIDQSMRAYKATSNGLGTASGAATGSHRCSEENSDKDGVMLYFVSIFHTTAHYQMLGERYLDNDGFDDDDDDDNPESKYSLSSRGHNRSRRHHSSYNSFPVARLLFYLGKFLDPA